MTRGSFELNQSSNTPGRGSQVRTAIRVAIVALPFILLLPFLNAPAGATTRVNTSLLMSAAISKVMPRYSAVAKGARVQGQVEVEVTINEAGKVQGARPVSGPEMLRDEAKNAALQWRFDAKKLSDPPGDVIGVLVFTFKLDN